jgi:tetratricopeptide (TPR) repeat protein
MPFFAVLAAPVAAWNFQEFLGEYAHDPRRWPARTLMAVLGLTFVVCAWPGWLQLPPYEPRRWEIELSPSLVQSALACRAWHEQGKLSPATKGLHLSRETAQVFSWMCPQAKDIWDQSLADPLLGLAKGDDDVGKRLRDAGIHHVIVHDPGPSRVRLFAAMNALGADPRQWPLLYLEGDVAIFGWWDPALPDAADPFAGWELDLERVALHPPPEKRAPPQPSADAESRRWWDAFWKPAPPRSFDRDEASAYLLRAEALRLSAPFRHLMSWEVSQIAALAAAAPGWTGASSLLDAPVRLQTYQPTLSRDAGQAANLPSFSIWVLAAQRSSRSHRDDSPPEILFLAIRAARRALLHNPQDANAQLILGDCYVRLMHHTRERAWGQRLNELIELRQAQASEALNQAVLLKPDLAQAHLKLSALYLDMGYFDLALRHRRAHLELFRKAGSQSNEESASHLQMRDQLDKELTMLADTVDKLERWHAENAAGLRVLDRARMAAHKGLTDKARQLLVESDVSAFGPQGTVLELKLLLRTGRAKDVREWTDPELAASLGAGNFRWLRAQAFAAGGNYAAAEEELGHLAVGGRAEGDMTPRAAIALMVAQQFGLESRLGGRSFAESIRRVLTRTVFLDRVNDLAQRMRQEADINVVLGVLALEQGRTEEAAASFRRALSIWNEADRGGAIDFDARVIAQGWLARLGP